MSKIVGIQAARALAAATVVARHTFPGFEVGSAGVDVFFVISGFVMVVSSAKLFGQHGAALTFMRRRILRIVPLYWSATLILAYFLPIYETSDVIKSLLFIPTFHHGLALPVLSVGWTLNVEMYFYLVFALFMFLPMRPAIACVAAWMLAATTIGLVVPEYLGITQPYYFTALTLEFVVGAFFGLLYLHDWRLPLPIAIPLIALGLGLLWFSNGRPFILGQEAISWGIPAALIVAGLGLGDFFPSQGKIASATDFAGNASYAVYLSHPIILTLLLTGEGAGLLRLVILIALGVLVYVLGDTAQQSDSL